VAPTPADARIHALDALRGVALLGIAWANVRQLFMPWEIGNFPVSFGANATLANLDWQVFHAFVDLKFLTLFSLLFGVGFALQSEHVAARGGGFNALYLRRVGILALFGLAHGVLLYPAEVLMPYAIAGLILLAAQRLSTDNLLRTGLVLLGISTLWGYELGGLGRVHVGITVTALMLFILAVATLWRRSWLLALTAWAAILLAAGAAVTLSFDESARGARVAQEYLAAQGQLTAIVAGSSSEWPEEFSVRRAGSFAALLSLHAGQYGLILLYFALVLLWRTLGLFMIGAGIFRSGVLERATPQTWRRVMRIALSIGLPLSILATWLHWREIQGELDWRWPEFLHSFGALPLAAGVAAAVFALYASGRVSAGMSSWIWARIEAAGRMALTNYVGQSFVMAAIAESWGLNL
ncbi:MAG: DUF418 domain-containing protein, partial [Steroidobacteraceae bacterium]